MPVSRRQKRDPSPLYLTHAGVSIYRTTRDDEGQIVRQFWFGTDPAVRECEGDHDAMHDDRGDRCDPADTHRPPRARVAGRSAA